MKAVQEVAAMAESNGWKYIKEEIIDHNIKVLRAKLENKRFDDISDVKEIQAELRAYNNILSSVEKRVNERFKN